MKVQPPSRRLRPFQTAEYPATETAQECALEAMRILGGNGYARDFPVERYYRDAPLLIIARNLLKKYAVNNS